MGLETTQELNDVIMQQVWNALWQTATIRVAEVVSYSASPRPTVTVQPCPRIRLPPIDGARSEFEDAPQLQEVPVMRLEFGPFVIDAELEKGDGGILVVSDRDADKWIDGGGGKFDPEMPLIHNLNHAFFLPMIRPNTKTAKVQVGKRTLYIGDATGKKVSIKLDEANNKIDIDAAVEVNVTAPAINLDTPGVLLGPYTIFGLNAGFLGTHIGTAPPGGGTIIWTANPAAGLLGAKIK